MTSCLLNVNQPPSELNRIYEDDYYWYLRDPIFCESIFRPVGDSVNSLRCPCLDVGCGEGQLSDYVNVPYLGFDGSVCAIRQARKLHPAHEFYAWRFEDPPHLDSRKFGTIVMSNLLEVLIKSEWHVRFAQQYLRYYHATYLVVVDLIRLNTSMLEKAFHLQRSEEVTAEVPNLLEVKKHRKILVFSNE